MNRSYFWDNYKGILIFLVVIGHYLYSYAMKIDGSLADDIFTLIYTFHMPAFIFCSGYLSKSEKSRSKYSIVLLLLYYVIFNTLMMFFAYYMKGTSLSLLEPYYSYWYLLSLVVWRILIVDLEKVKGIIPLSIMVTLLLGFWGEFTNILSIRRTIAFFIYFLLGYKLKKETMESFLQKRTRIVCLVGWIIAIIGVIGVLWLVSNYHFTLSMLLLNGYKKTSDAIIVNGKLPTYFTEP